MSDAAADIAAAPLPRRERKAKGLPSEGVAGAPPAASPAQSHGAPAAPASRPARAKKGDASPSDASSSAPPAPAPAPASAPSSTPAASAAPGVRTARSKKGDAPAGGDAAPVAAAAPTGGASATTASSAMRSSRASKGAAVAPLAAAVPLSTAALQPAAQPPPPPPGPGPSLAERAARRAAKASTAAVVPAVGAPPAASASAAASAAPGSGGGRRVAAAVLLPLVPAATPPPAPAVGSRRRAADSSALAAVPTASSVAVVAMRAAATEPPRRAAPPAAASPAALPSGAAAAASRGIRLPAAAAESRERGVDRSVRDSRGGGGDGYRVERSDGYGRGERGDGEGRVERGVFMSAGLSGPRLGKDKVWEDELALPPDLTGWASSSKGALVASQVKSQTGVSEVRFSVAVGGFGARPSASARVRGNDRDAVRKACAILTVHIEAQHHMAGMLAEAERLRRDEAVVEQEIAAGLRVEFTVPLEVVGLIIGKSGANLAMIEEETQVYKIIVDSKVDPAEVRIKGPTKEAVEDARRKVEWKILSIPVTRSQLAWLTADDKLEDIRVKTLVRDIHTEEVPGSDGRSSASILITGLRAQAEIAQAMIETRLSYIDVAKDTSAEIAEVTRRVQSLKVAYGDRDRRRRTTDDDDEDADPHRGGYGRSSGGFGRGGEGHSSYGRGGTARGGSGGGRGGSRGRSGPGRSGRG